MKPYPAYKDSGVVWLGEAPAHWEVERLKFAAKINPSRSEIRNLPPDLEVSFYPMEAVGVGRLHEGQVRLLSDVSSGFTYFRDDDVLIAKITPSFENGKGALANGLANGIGFGTTELHVIRPTSEINKEFLFYLTYSHEFRHPGEGMMDGTAGQKRIPNEFLIDYRTAIPPLPEQTAITAYLDRKTAQIDAVIARKERMIKLLREERTAVISQAVTKGLNPDAPMKNSGVAWLGEVPAHWEVKRLKHILARNDGGAWGEEGSLDDTPVLRSTEINLDGTWDLVEPARRKLTQKELDATRLISGDLLVTKSSGSSAHIGKTALVTKEVEAMEASFSNFMQRLRLDPAHGPVIYFHFLNNEIGREQLDYLSSTTTGLKNLTAAVLEDVFVTSPPFPEQTAIAAYLDRKTAQIDQTIVRTEAQIERLCEYRTALISAVVTGKVDVREEVEE